jgi:hypothetical protein
MGSRSTKTGLALSRAITPVVERKVKGGSKNIVARLNFYSHKRSEKSVLTRRYSSSMIRIRVDFSFEFFDF